LFFPHYAEGKTILYSTLINFMKKISILLILTLFVQAFVFAAAPTVTASNLIFSSIDGSRFTGRCTPGNGTYRIVVMKEGSPVVGRPVNGVEYTANASFGTATTRFTGEGEFVVARTSWGEVTPTDLKPGTIYYVAIFEYNGTGANTQYLTLPLEGSQITAVAPTTQVTALVATATTGNTISLSWSKGNGSGRLIVARKGSAVDVSPVDLTNYYAGDNYFEGGTKIGTDHWVVYKGAGTTATIKNLEPNTTYHFAAFEYNGSFSPIHLTPGVSASATTNAGPTKAPSSPGFNYVEGNRFTISVSAGNGTRRLFIAKKGSEVTAVPVSGTMYTANSAFGTPGTEIAPGEFVVGATGSSVSVTNLEANTVYHFRVYEYDVDKENNAYYLTSSYAVKSGSTAITPTTIGTNLRLTNLTGSSASIGLTHGNGTYRMVIMKAGSEVDAVPANYTRYSGNSAFGSGTQMTPGNYVVAGLINGNPFTVNSLQPGITYHVAIYEFNGNDYPVYSENPARFSFSIPVQPTIASSKPTTHFIEGKSFRLVWTSGNGAKRVLIAKKGSEVTARPADNISYTANESFGQGDEIAPDEFVMYNGSSHYIDLSDFEVSGTYHFALFEYNVDGEGKPDYLIDPYLSTTVSTVTWPTMQPVISGVSGLQATQATINFTKGNGEGRIFIMKEGSAVNLEPQDLVKYSYSSSFGSSGSHISGGNYVVWLGGGTGYLTATNLKANTNYFVSAFEYNGSAQPAYLKTEPATFSFTTPDVPGATVPTTPATNPIVNSVDGNRLTLKWTNGNGGKRIVIMRKDAPVDFMPSSSTNYIANNAFGNGMDLGGAQYVVYNNTGSSVDLTNLLPSSTYHFAVFEYNGTGDLIRYLATSLTGAASTSSAPIVVAGGINAVTSSGQMVLSWTNGSGSGRIVVMKEGSAITATPADMSVYPANAAFKSGSQMAAGEYVVYAGNSNTVTITGLTNNVLYHYRIFEYNGSAAPVYNNAAAVIGSATPSSALPITLLYFNAKEAAGSVQLKWATAQERTNDYFIIERSMDGANYEGIKTIAGAGNSNVILEYSYTDASISAEGKIYYRLKQADLDGKFTYSSVQVVTLNGNEKINVYPNPVRDQFKVDLPAGISNAVLHIYDAKGMLVSVQRIVDGQTVSTNGWNSGSYYLLIKSGDKQFRTTIVKQ
jgi:hypothetical protein